MKYLSILLVTNILAVSIIFSAADDPIDSSVRDVSSRTDLIIKDRKEPDVGPLLGNIKFSDNQGNSIIETESGSTIQFEIKVDSTELFQMGRVKSCVMYEKDNPSNSKQLWNECSMNDGSPEWKWVSEKATFQKNLNIVKLPGSQSPIVTVECSAIVCKNACPELKCPGKRRKRRGLIKKPFSFFIRAQKVG